MLDPVRVTIAPAARQGDAREVTYEGSWVRRVVVVLVALKIAGVLVLFDPIGFQTFDSPKSLFSRAMGWLLAAAIALLLMRFGAGIVPRTRLHLLVLALLAANGLAALFAENHYLAVFGERSRYLGLTFLFDMAVLYAAVAIAFRRLADWLVVGAAVLAGFVAAVGYGALQRLDLDPVPWPEQLRPFGTLGNADMLGHFLAVAFGLALGIAVFWRRHRLAVVALSLAVAAVALTAITYVAATRASLLGVAAALALLPALVVRLRGASRAGLRELLVALIALVLMGSALVGSPLGERVLSTLAGVGTTDRLLIYESAIRAAADRPLLGYGPDNFGAAYPRYRQPEANAVFGPRTNTTSAHSWLIHSAATTGVVGLASLLALIAAFALYLYRDGLRERYELAAPLLLGLMSYWTTGLVSVGSVSVDWFPWLAFGGAATLAPSTQGVPRRWGPNLFAAALLVAVALFGVLSGHRAFQANREAAAAQAAWAGRHARTAVDSARAAVELDRGRASYWNLLGLALTLERRWEESLAAFSEAATRAPHEYVYWENVARGRLRQALEGDARSGGRQAVMAAAHKGVDADPNNAAARAAFADIAISLGEYDVALDAAIRAIELLPTNAAYDALAGEAALRWSDHPAARARLETTLATKDTVTLRVALARLSLLLNDIAAARAHAKRALELAPDNADAHAILRVIGG